MIRRDGPWLVREIEYPKAWREAKLDSKHISEAFPTCEEAVSVYQVETDVQEAEVAAALWLGAGATLKDPQHLLRIAVEDVEDAGLQQIKSPGGTDVRHVDAMHRDLVGDPSRFNALADTIAARSRAGQDTVRTVAGRGLSQRIADFLASGAVGVGSKNKAKRELDKADAKWPRA